VRAGKSHQLQMQHVVESDVGGVLLQAGHALEGTDSWKRRDDRVHSLLTGLKPCATCVLLFRVALCHLCPAFPG
jgi:hypothetical protein